MNCYPGDPNHPCYPLAVFLSLHGRLAKGTKWSYYNFENILQEIIRHVQGSCPGVTRDVVLITDSWLAPNIEKWQAVIRNIIVEKGINVEVYLIGYPDLINPLRIYWTIKIPKKCDKRILQLDL